MQRIKIQYPSSICPAPQKMIITIDTCTATVYVFIFITCYLPSTTLYRYLAADLRNVALSLRPEIKTARVFCHQRVNFYPNFERMQESTVAVCFYYYLHPIILTRC